jgi:predicted alpha/beta superfamily hydrolase
MKHFLPVFIILFLLACKANQTERSALHVSSGKVERIENFDSKYIEARNIDIWLPYNYNRNESFSVLYMHDGQMLFDSSITWNKQEWAVDETMSKLMDEKKIKNTIVVGIWNSGKNRRSDYWPQKPFEALSTKYQEWLFKEGKTSYGSPLFDTIVMSDHYLRFIVKELKPYIDKNYSTRGDNENTFIMGSSMGGLISMYAICEYPEVFGGAACLSTHWTGSHEKENNPVPKTFVDYMAKYLPSPSNHKFYFDYGTKGLDSLYEPFQKQIDSVFLLKGYSDGKWITKKFQGYNHSEKSWQSRLHIPLEFLLKK